MTDYTEILQAAIDRESEILGERAFEIARETGIKIDSNGNVSDFEGTGTEKLEELVDKYSDIGGKVTVHLIAREIAKLDTSNIRLPDKIERHK